MTEDTTVTVRTVDALVSCNINQITKHSVHAVVLLLDIIKVLSISIKGVATKDSLQKKESIEVRVFPIRSIIEYSYIGVDHLIISDEEQCWDVDWFVSVVNRFGIPLGDSLEVLVNQVNKLIVIDIASSHYDHIVSEVISRMEVDYHIPIYLIDVIYIS